MNAITKAGPGGKLSSLEAIEWARQRLEEARTFEDVLEISDRAADRVAERVRAVRDEATQSAGGAMGLKRSQPLELEHTRDPEREFERELERVRQAPSDAPAHEVARRAALADIVERAHAKWAEIGRQRA